MKKIKSMLAILTVAAMLTACEKESDDMPIPGGSGGTKPSCEVNHTVTITFENRTTTGAIYKIKWDGAILGSSSPLLIYPGDKVGPYTYTAGKHTLQFVATNGVSSNVITLSIIQCSNIGYSWAY